jgi:Na+-translocating ferredoxin:NAD+ oxidoreductase RnfG subunit
MAKNLVVLMVFVFCLSSFPIAPCHAFTLLTKEDALKQVLGEDVEIIPETKTLEGDVLERVKQRLGGKLIDYQEGSESVAVEASKTVTFYFGAKDGKKSIVALIDVEPGKWGPVEFIIALDPDGIVKKVAVMSYQEKRGRPIARESFLRQYEGKSSKSTLEVGKDIIGVSGATISSRAATFAVKKAIALLEEFYLKH